MGKLRQLVDARELDAREQSSLRKPQHGTRIVPRPTPTAARPMPSLGQRIVSNILATGDLEPYLDSGLDLRWLEAPDQGSEAVFGPCDGSWYKAYRFVLQHSSEHDRFGGLRVPSAENFLTSYGDVALVDEDVHARELVALAESRIRMVTGNRPPCAPPGPTGGRPQCRTLTLPKRGPSGEIIQGARYCTHLAEPETDTCQYHRSRAENGAGKTPSPTTATPCPGCEDGMCLWCGQCHNGCAAVRLQEARSQPARLNHAEVRFGPGAADLVASDGNVIVSWTMTEDDLELLVAEANVALLKMRRAKSENVSTIQRPTGRRVVRRVAEA